MNSPGGQGGDGPSLLVGSSGRAPDPCCDLCLVSRWRTLVDHLGIPRPASCLASLIFTFDVQIDGRLECKVSPEFTNQRHAEGSMSTRVLVCADGRSPGGLTPHPNGKQNVEAPRITWRPYKPTSETLRATTMEMVSIALFNTRQTTPAAITKTPLTPRSSEVYRRWLPKSLFVFVVFARGPFDELPSSKDLDWWLMAFASNSDDLNDLRRTGIV
jgi:hypothetical protein